MAAICYLKFSVGCIYLVCLFLVQPASPFDDESYYRYDCLDCSSSRRLDVEIDNSFMRHRRQAVSSASSNPNETDTTSQSHSGTDASLPTTHPDDGGAGNKLTRVQLQSAADGGFIHHHVLTGGIGGNTTDPLATNVTADSHAPQIIGADFDPNTKPVSNLSDLLKEEKDTDITINQFLEDREITSDTLKQFNATKYLKLINDTHIYYNSSFIVDEKIGQQYWVDMTSDKVNVHDMLSQSHRRAATVQLSFNFPFYGHLVNNVTIATGGFLFTGDHIHIWLAATQYIAPLMANFDTRISEGSFVKYLDNGTAFTVLWENVILKDSPEHGNFTFEATLHENGDIVFVYKNIPVMIEQIKDVNHPVKVGISDAYIIDRTIFFVKRKTIYEYHRVNFSKEDIRNWTVIYLQALPTCRDMKDCDSCIHADNVNLECKWCPSVERCSTGLDRARQEWLAHECDKMNVKQCNEPPPPPHAHKAAEPAMVHAKQSDGSHSEKSTTVVGTSGVISLLLLITSLAAIAFLFLYAYRNPHSTPGQILIRYRPSQWSWRRGEARYTAATIHM